MISFRDQPLDTSRYSLRRSVVVALICRMAVNCVSKSAATSTVLVSVGDILSRIPTGESCDESASWVIELR